MTFDSATAVERADDTTWTGSIQPGWDIFENANGGYMMAIAARAMSGAADGRLPVSVTAHFTRPGKPGRVSITTEIVRAGRTFSTVRANLSSEAGVVLAMLGTFAEADRSPGDTLLVDAEIPEVPPPDECIPALPAVDGPLPPPLMSKVEERIHPDDAGTLLGKPTGRPRMRGWLRLRDGERMTPFTLLLAADAFSPAIFNTTLPLAWTPTLEMTTQIRATEVEGWLRCQFTTRFITGGFLEEDGEVWDEEGRLVAQSRQIALIPR
ncbi:MAG: thioesterase family protein [Acidimicrobiia bacterium]